MLKHFTPLIFLLPLAAIGCSRQSDVFDDPVPFPESLPARVELPDDSQGIDGRFKLVSPDTGRLIYVRTEFRNGETALELFRDDESLREVQVHYPLPENSGGSGEARERQSKLDLIYDEDGRTVLLEHAYAADGKPMRYGSRLPDGSFDTRDYYSDGSTVHRHRVLDRKDQIVLVELFRKTAPSKAPAGSTAMEAASWWSTAAMVLPARPPDAARALMSLSTGRYSPKTARLS